MSLAGGQKHQEAVDEDEYWEFLVADNKRRVGQEIVIIATAKQTELLR